MEKTKKQRLLVVDNDPDWFRFIRLFLEKSNREVVWARSGEEALAVLSVSEPVAILSETNLPGMNGLALIREVRRKHPELPIIAFHDGMVWISRELHVGVPVADEYLTAVGATAVLAKSDTVDRLPKLLDSLTPKLALVAQS